MHIAHIRIEIVAHCKVNALGKSLLQIVSAVQITSIVVVVVVGIVVRFLSGLDILTSANMHFATHLNGCKINRCKYFDLVGKKIVCFFLVLFSVLFWRLHLHAMKTHFNHQLSVNCTNEMPNAN